MKDTTAKYKDAAAGWSEGQYADPSGYLGHRADLVVSLGPLLQPGDTVLDFACGDAGLADHLLPRGLRYLGVDASDAMVAAARARLGDRARIELGDLNDYAPPEPVAATTIFRAIYYARDRRELFRRLGGFTERKLVFDLNPRQYRLEDVAADLEASGFDGLELRPFFAPQNVALPGPLGAALRAAERVGPIARAALRFRFSYLCAAYRG
ncbi:MAG: methyltransferase domain-containing protein [Thermoleophilia bacterium]